MTIIITTTTTGCCAVNQYVHHRAVQVGHTNGATTKWMLLNASKVVLVMASCYFGHFWWWPYSHADWQIQLSARGFLLVFNSNHIPIMQILHYGHRTDRWIATLLNATHHRADSIIILVRVTNPTLSLTPALRLPCLHRDVISILYPSLQMT